MADIDNLKNHFHTGSCRGRGQQNLNAGYQFVWLPAECEELERLGLVTIAA